MIEQLKRQIEYFSSDQLLIERAAPFRDLTPEECWAETIASCKEVDWLFSLMEPDVRERAMQPEPIPDHVLRTLEAMQRR
jgi:hypothetical protein